MPRDVSGNYTLPAGNPVVSGAIIESTWANNTMPDMAVELTDSLSRSGNGGMLVPFRLASGLEASPSLSFTADTITGRYLSTTSDMREVVGGADIARWTATGLEIWVGAAFEKVLTSSFNPVPAGTKMLFVQAAAPVGWTQDATHNNKALRLVSGTGAGTGGSVAFTTAFTSARASSSTGAHSHTITVNNHTLTTAQMPSHRHLTGVDTDSGTLLTASNSHTRVRAGNYTLGASATEPNIDRTTSVGSSSGHNHTASSASAGAHTHTTNLDVQYVDTIICTKD